MFNVILITESPLCMLLVALVDAMPPVDRHFSEGYLVVLGLS